MSLRTDLKIPYGVSDFKTIRTEGLYYVDKTEYLAKIEERDRFVFFVRPRRFGKSLFLDMLRLYYDRNEKVNFEKLFGGLWIGAHPTPNRNRYLMLALDFSEVGGMGGASLSEKFNNYAQQVAATLNAQDVRTIVDDRNEKIGREIRDNEIKHIPYMLVVGEKESADGTVNVRKQGTQQQETMKIEEFAKKIQEEVRQMTENF